jgi:hypothetical protein
MMRCTQVVLVCLVFSCQCKPPPVVPTESVLQVTPRELQFGQVFIGDTKVLQIEISNAGKSPIEVQLDSTIPFTSIKSISLQGGSVESIDVTFAPTETGDFGSKLKIFTSTESIEVSLNGTGKPIPMCAVEPCASWTFSYSTGQCEKTVKPDSTSCTSACNSPGQCVSGECLSESAPSCNDNNLCTLDFCGGDGGCFHREKPIPVSDAGCQFFTCTPETGVALVNQDDGVVCGDESCLKSQVDVCIAGQCVSRPRPNSTRCVNTWVPAHVPTSFRPEMAFDSKRNNMVAYLDDMTWEFDGTTWAQRYPANNPGQRAAHAMAFDESRGRTVLFGGESGNSTWEFDGVTWIQRSPANSPPTTYYAEMVYDSKRRKVVMFGGGSGAGAQALTDDTWEYNGVTWLKLNPLTKPPARGVHGLTYDSARERIVLFGGSQLLLANGSTYLGDTWEFDGTSWTQLMISGPTPRMRSTLTYDPARRVTVLFGGNDYDPRSDTWELKDGQWTQKQTVRTPRERSGHAAAFDSRRNKIVIFGKSDGVGDTWDFDGTEWTPRFVLPPRLHGFAAANFLSGFVAFTGQEAFPSLALTNEAWRFSVDAGAWTKIDANVVPGRAFAGFASDEAHRRLWMYGGDSRISNPGGSVGTMHADTWFYDGLTWNSVLTVNAPSPGHAENMVFDIPRQRLLLARGDGTWEFDGGTWTNVASSAQTPSIASQMAMVYSPALNQTILFGAGKTSTWNGSIWTSVPDAGGPSVSVPVAAFDALRQQVVMMNNNDKTLWTFDGASWSALPVATKVPPNSSSRGFGFSGETNRLYFYNGNDVWTYLP